MPLFQSIKTCYEALLSLFFPDSCQICNQILTDGESFICIHCLCKLPQTGYHLHLSNPAEERFRGKFPYQRISAFLHFEKGGYTQRIIHRIKYKDSEAFGIRCGQLMAEEIKSSGFFSGIDLIIPVPLHRKKYKKRGFNQAEALASGLSANLHINYDTKSLVKVRGNSSQTKKSRYERWLNSQEMFAVKDPHTFSGKHILLVDDVITTGATLESCARCILESKDCRISILTLAISQ